MIEADCGRKRFFFAVHMYGVRVKVCGVRTSRAGVDSSTWVDWATSAAWMLLWYATS